ncbi:MBL fold metallo-hydrolase [Candidatus Fermentibacteria bacterium]|nr:MBL fold metallo-hydrolase [Candidatus Fermentibacteria bacterium]
MIVIPLQSGSSGNCIYVESGDTAVLLDAGVAGVHVQRRLDARGCDIRGVRAVVVSHDHMDHASHAGVLHRKCGIPVYCTMATIARMREKMEVGRIGDLQLFSAGTTLAIGSLLIDTIPTPHDGADGVAFIVRAEGLRLGILTDLGHVFPGLSERIAALDAVIIESNYDPDLLARGPYPPWLQARIKGPGGHLSNEESAGILSAANRTRLQWACLAHLSENNNRPDLAETAHRALLGSELRLFIADRYGACGPFEVVA